MKKLPACGHETMAECSRVAEDICCPFACDIRLPCGHKCRRTCHPLSDPDHFEVSLEELCSIYFSNFLISSLNEKRYYHRIQNYIFIANI
jgi:hypothetical protein